ncbi:hypothetical protein Y032_0113g389 [Ancylostoma ceylanicum]|uniref:Uncharacterized protein n=1 Tax=Ancylostoma ceylanicum TaxID=53326 RepID=A0A016TDH6_9BILA|nr:hypothetical protein Y032_0113g389 [Ancylostoma ceylanicum]
MGHCVNVPILYFHFLAHNSDHREYYNNRWIERNLAQFRFRHEICREPRCFRRAADHYCCLKYSQLQAVVDKGRHRSAGTLVVSCTESAGLLSRDTKENRAAVPALVYDRLEFIVHQEKVREIWNWRRLFQKLHVWFAACGWKQTHLVTTIWEI